MELFPISLKLQGRPCLVVGAGKIAASKITSLLRCGAEVRVVAPTAVAAVRKLAQSGRISWLRREFRPSDLAPAFLVVAATGSPELHQRIFRQARRRGILCNSVDDPQRCDFYYPAVVRRGPLQIAISTGGQSPALAQRLRKQLERQFGPEYATWTEALGRARRELLRRGLPVRRRRSLLRRLSGECAYLDFVKRTGASRARKAKGLHP